MRKTPPSRKVFMSNIAIVCYLALRKPLLHLVTTGRHRPLQGRTVLRKACNHVHKALCHIAPTTAPNLSHAQSHGMT